ncbi:Hypothetical protein FKW44_014275, partial [Caligus rogercresseyi]
YMKLSSQNEECNNTPSYSGQNVDEQNCPQIPVQMREDAMKLLEDLDPSFPGIMAAFQIEDSSLFPASAFISSVKDILKPIKYWRYVAKNTELVPLMEF